MKKFSFLSILIIFCVVCVIIVGVIYLMTPEKVSLEHKNAEAQELLDKNQNAITEAQNATSNSVKPITEADHYLGDLNAPVQIIIYDDFECPFCSRFYDTTEQIKDEFGDKVLIAFRHYPLSSHYNAMPAGLAAECASEQGKFWEMYHKLFALNKENNLSPGQYKKSAEEIGLDIVEYLKCFEQEKYKDKILAQIIEAKNIGVSGTPTVYINREIYPGAYPFEDFKGRDGKIQEGMKSVINRHLEKF